MLFVRSNMVISEPNQNRSDFITETTVSRLSVMWLSIFWGRCHCVPWVKLGWPGKGVTWLGLSVSCDVERSVGGAAKLKPVSCSSWNCFLPVRLHGTPALAWEVVWVSFQVNFPFVFFCQSPCFLVLFPPCLIHPSCLATVNKLRNLPHSQFWKLDEKKF